jgi:hypothetical protein
MASRLIANSGSVLVPACSASQLRSTATIAYNAVTGDKVWVKRYNGPSSNGDYAYSMAARAGQLFVAGPSHGISSGLDYAIVAYNG